MKAPSAVIQELSFQQTRMDMALSPKSSTMDVMYLDALGILLGLRAP